METWKHRSTPIENTRYDTVSNATASQHHSLLTNVSQSMDRVGINGFCLAAVGICVGSTALYLSGRRPLGLFLGQLVPSLLVAGLYQRANHIWAEELKHEERILN